MLRITGDHDNTDALSMQAIDQAVGPLAPSETDVDDGYVWRVIGEQALGVGRGRGRPGHVRSHHLKQSLHGLANVP
jgi:hypothetical protein